jgi:hypothetical protein
MSLIRSKSVISFELITVIVVKIVVFWAVTESNLIGGSRRFGGTYVCMVKYPGQVTGSFVLYSYCFSIEVL